MVSVTTDIRQLSGIADNYEPEKAASVSFSPYRPYHVEDGGDDFLVSSEILRKPLVDGVDVSILPQTPVDNLMKVQLRGVRGYGTPFYVQVPATDCNLFDLAHIDPDTLDPVAPADPAWLSHFAAAVAAADAAEASAAAAESDAAAANVSAAAAVVSAAAAEVDADAAAISAAAAEVDADAAAASAASASGGSDAFIAGRVNTTGSATEVALSAKYAGAQKFDRGGIVLAPLRTPTLTVGAQWPNRNHDYRILWASADGYTLYGSGEDRVLRKSTDGGVTWTKRGYSALGFGGSSTFVITAAGSLLTFKKAFPLSNTLMRSTDDGATWATVHNETSRVIHGLAPMHVTSIKQDPVTNYIYWAEYQNINTATDVKIYRSTDDGATWTTFHTFAGPASADPNKIRHVHSIEWDHIMGRIVFMVGDDDPKAGLYRVNAAGTGVEVLVTNDMITNVFTDGFMATRCARAISYIPFPDCIVYGGDTASNPFIMRIPRSELSNPNPLAERLYEVNSTAWFACKASDDGSRWVMSASQEAPGTRLDSAVHLYSIEDQGDTITEAATLSMNQPTLASLFPVGNSTHGGDTFYLGSYETDGRYGFWRCELARGGNSMLPWPDPRPMTPMWQSVSSGSVTLAAGAEKVFAVTTVPRGDMIRFRLNEINVRAFPTNNAGLKLTIRTSGGSVIWENTVTVPSYRQWFDESGAAKVYETALASNTEIHFVLRNTSGLSLDCVGGVVFGFGPLQPY